MFVQEAFAGNIDSDLWQALTQLTQLVLKWSAWPKAIRLPCSWVESPKWICCVCTCIQCNWWPLLCPTTHPPDRLHRGQWWFIWAVLNRLGTVQSIVRSLIGICDLLTGKTIFCQNLHTYTSWSCSKAFYKRPFQALATNTSVINSSGLKQATNRSCRGVAQLLTGKLTGICKSTIRT